MTYSVLDHLLVNVETGVGVEVVVLFCFIVHGRKLGEELLVVEPVGRAAGEAYFLGFLNFLTNIELFTLIG